MDFCLTHKGDIMTTNLDRYKKDLSELIKKGNKLHNAIQFYCLPKEFTKQVIDELGDKADEFIANIPSFLDDYQKWYSEALVLIKQLLPDRLIDFIRYYEKPKGRKDITYENYRIEDCLQNLIIYRGLQKVLGPEAAIPHFQQQLAILNSVDARFESSLFDIRQLVQADLFDSELEAATELNNKKFSRAAGALAGVVLERHLGQVCDNHNINIRKRNPTISDFNDALKKSEVIEIVQWRFVQSLGDIRNLCDHDKKVEPTTDQVDDLISGTMKIIKTMF